MGNNIMQGNATLEKRMPDFNENCFDILRLMAAFIVVFSHSFKWFGYTKPLWMLCFTDGSVGVIILYALSGYLTYASYDRIVKSGGNVWLFWYKRIVRICPLYLLTSVLMVFIDIIRRVDVNNLSYIIRRFLHIFTFGLIYVPDGITNGVIWSLRVELVFYFIVPFVYILLNKQNITVWIATIAALWQFNVWDDKFLAFLAKIPVVHLLSRMDNPAMFMYQFIIGSLFYCHRDKMLALFARKQVIIPLTTVFVIWTFLYDKCNIIGKFGVMHNPIYGLVIPFITIGLGYAFGKIRLGFDISYGVFLFHMLVIYEVLRLTKGGIPWMILSWGIIVAISFGMHYAFEKPVKKLTNKMERWLEMKLKK